MSFSDPSGHIAICFQGGENSSGKENHKGGTPAIHTMCQESLTQAGYDEKLHGQIHYFSYNGSNEKQNAINLILGRERGEPAILIGHSWGGAAVLEIAADLNAYGESLRAQPMANLDYAAMTTIDALITIDPEPFGREDTPTAASGNVRFSINIAPKDGWTYRKFGQSYLSGTDSPVNDQNGLNHIEGALNVNLEYVYSALASKHERMDHDTIVNLTAHNDGQPTEINPVTRSMVGYGVRQGLR